MQSYRDPTIAEKYLEIFLTDISIFTSISKKYPEIKDDLNSSRENVHCDCRKRVVTFLNEKLKIKEDLIFLEDLLNNNSIAILKKQIDEKFKIEKQNYELYISKREAGKKIYKINKDEKSWQDFFEFAENNINFRDAFLLEKEDYLEIRFL